MQNEYMLNLRDIKVILKKRVKLIVIILMINMVGGVVFGLLPSKKEVETRVSILVDKPISKEEMIRGDYDYLRFINAKNITGPTELAKSQKIMKKVIEAGKLKYDLKKINKIFNVSNNVDANMININVRGNDVEKVNKMLDTYTEEFLNEAKKLYKDTNFLVLDKENIEYINQSIVVKCSKFAIIGIIVGMFIAFGIVFLLDIIDKTVKKEDELEALGLSVLAVIPNEK